MNKCLDEFTFVKSTSCGNCTSSDSEYESSSY